MLTAGIDAGSRTTKVVLWDAANRRVQAWRTQTQGVERPGLAEGLLQELLAEVGVDRAQVAAIVATGYGRNQIASATTTITEITCHACGVAHWAPDARTVIEIGGQDSKLIRLNAAGQVFDFAMNDRCAAGTGRFLEVVAARLEIPLEALGALAGQSDQASPISNMCVVFAETEIIGLLARGESPANIVAGVQTAIASRTVAMGGRRVEGPVYFTGGVALVPGMAAALERSLGQPVQICPEPMLTGALGAALLAEQHAKTAYARP